MSSPAPPPSAPHIGFVGGGNMASALVGGLLRGGHPTSRIAVVEPDATARARLAAQGIACSADSNKLADCDIVVLAVKPQVLRAVAQQHAAALRPALVVSVAAGVRLTDLERWLGGHHRLVRAMPNTPALVGAGVTGLAASPGLSDSDRDTAARLFAAVGSVVWVANDAGIDAVTAVSGSGPAYVLLLAEALAAAAVEQGLDADTAARLAADTLAGTAALLHSASEPAATLRARVTSPGGTTERGIAALQDGGFETLLARAVSAARERAAELGALFGKD